MPSYEIVVTCSIIFHAVKLLQSAEENALCHLNNGLAIFNAWKQQREGDSLDSDKPFDQIATVLGRLDLSATIADKDRIPVSEHNRDELLSKFIAY